MNNYTQLQRENEPVSKYHARLIHVSFLHGFSGGNAHEMADYIVVNNLVDALDSFNPVGPVRHDFSALYAGPNSFCAACGQAYRQHPALKNPAHCWFCQGKK